VRWQSLAVLSSRQSPKIGSRFSGAGLPLPRPRSDTAEHLDSLTPCKRPSAWRESQVKFTASPSLFVIRVDQTPGSLVSWTPPPEYCMNACPKRAASAEIATWPPDFWSSWILSSLTCANSTFDTSSSITRLLSSSLSAECFREWVPVLSQAWRPFERVTARVVSRVSCLVPPPFP